MKTPRLVVFVTAALTVVTLAACGAQDASSPAGDPLPVQSSAASTPTKSTEGSDVQSLVQAAGLAPCPTSGNTPPVDGGLPELTLPCLGEGPAVNLAGVRGQPMVVNVWQSYCVPCATELPILGQVYREHSDQIRFLGIDLADERAAALKMAATTKMGFPSVTDQQSTVRGPLRIVGVPTTIYVRADGVIAGRSTGEITSRAQLVSDIQKYLGVQLS